MQPIMPLMISEYPVWYSLGFGDPPKDLHAWVLRTEWIKDSILKECKKCGKAAEGKTNGETRNKKKDKDKKRSFPLRVEL